LNKDEPFEQRSRANVLQVVNERIVKYEVVQVWDLWSSLTKSAEIKATVAKDFPQADLKFISWLTADFITRPQSSEAITTGVRTAILGSLWTILFTILFAFPIGVGAAIYLEEYATDNWLNRLIRTNINNLAGVPSIVYGILGLAIFVRTLEPLTSGEIFGLVDATTANGRTVLAAGLTLGLLVLPIIIINAQEAIRAVPQSLRKASYGLGATKWQTIWSHV
jgi:phosphate transport system permease protein